MRPELFHIDTALLTARTVVRRFRENEGELIYDLFQANLALLIDNFPKTQRALENREKAELFVRQSITDWMMQQGYTFGIWDNESARLIGLIRLFRLDWDVPKCEMNYLMDHSFSGKGIMTEAAQAVVRFAFQTLKMEKLYIRASMENFASQRLARKLGFRREGDLRADFRMPGGELVDTMLLGLTRQDFEK